MASRSLADFLEKLAQQQQLVRVAAEVDPELEIAEITRRVARVAGPALLFDRVRGHSLAVVTNLFGSEGRLCLALGIQSLGELSGRIESLLAGNMPQSWFERLKAGGEPAPLEKLRPRTVKAAPCQQVVRLGRDLDLAALPAIRCWPGESGRAITAAQIVSSDVLGRERSVNLCPVQMLDRNRLAILDAGQGSLARHWAGFRERGEKMPLAIVVGGDPAQMVAASLPVPADVDGYLVAGLLRGSAVDLIKCRMHALEVSAEADVVLEGYLDPLAEPATVSAGGWGGGHYRVPEPAIVMEVAAVTERTNPVFPAIVPSVDGGEIALLRKAKERMLLPVVKSVIPELVDLALPSFGGGDRYAVLAVHKTYPHQARRVASALWGTSALESTKFVVLVDQHVDVHDPAQVLAAVGENVFPARDVFFHEGPGYAFDHSAPTPRVGHALGIDATAKLAGEHDRPWPAELTPGQAILDLVASRWREYGLPGEA